MVDGVTVDLEALTTFAAALAKVADERLTGSVGDAANLTGLTARLSVESGVTTEDMCLTSPGFVEAQNFAIRHDVMAQSALQLMSDAVLGVAALALGAETCAMHYGATDRSNAAAMGRVRVGGSGDARFSGLTVRLSGSARVTSSDVLSAFGPTADQAMISSPVLVNPAPSSGPAGGTPAASTPAWAANRVVPPKSPTGGAATPTGTAAVPAPVVPTRPQTQEERDAEQRRLAQQLRTTGVIQSDGAPANDPGNGFTIGKDPVMQVQPDTVKIPLKPELPHAPVKK